MGLFDILFGDSSGKRFTTKGKARSGKRAGGSHYGVRQAGSKSGVG